MIGIYNNGLILMHRGDSYSTPLFINAGTNQQPVRYNLKDFVLIIDYTNLELGTIIKEGSKITYGSTLNGLQVQETTILGQDIEIIDFTTLYPHSFLKVDSIIKEGSILNRKEITNDISILADKVYMGIMENNQVFENAIVMKVFDINSNLNEYGDIIIEFKPEDTVNLLPGKYKYQIKAKLINEYNEPEVNTIVASRFVIEE